MGALVNVSAVMTWMKENDKGEARYFNINPGFLESAGSENKLMCWQIIPRGSDCAFYVGFRTREVVEFPDSGDFVPVKEVGESDVFPDGEKYWLVRYELAFYKNFERADERPVGILPKGEYQVADAF